MIEKTFTLKFSEEKLSDNGNVRILRSENSADSLYGFDGDVLLNWRLGVDGNWRQSIMGHTDCNWNRGQHVFTITGGKDVVISTVADGIRTYLCDTEDETRTSFLPVATLNDSDLMFGRFYRDPSRMGLLITHRASAKVEFYEMSIGKILLSFESDSSRAQNLRKHCGADTKIMLAQLRKELKQTLICRKYPSSSSDLFVFEFDINDNIQFVVDIPFEGGLIGESDEIFFANLCGHERWMDAIVFSWRGMFLFQYSEKPRKAYKLISYNPMFSLVKGWTERHTRTVRFEDVDNDGLDDLIFTGPGGIEILRYDFRSNKWKSLLDKGKLTSQERHATVLLPLMQRQEEEDNQKAAAAAAAILITSHSGAVHWANVVSRPPEIVNIPSVNRRFPVVLADSTIVPQMRYLSNQYPKSVLLLKDQDIWFDHTSSVNPKTGRPTFALPLVSEAESTLKFHLFYDGSSKANSPFGVGWSTPQNFIIASFQDGNFAEDESYILVIDDVPHRLRWLAQNSTATQLVFEFDDPSTAQNRSRDEMQFRADFNTTNDSWTIEFRNFSRMFYGNFGSDSGAIITDTAWQHWRGIGVDDSDRVERANMWHLAATEFKGTLCSYQYEVLRTENPSNHLAYNAGTVLASIACPFSQITFNYTRQEDDENLPLLLSSYDYQTKTNEQKLIFRYEKVHRSLLMTAIEQNSERVLQMEYRTFPRQRHLLQRITLPTGSEIFYIYSLLGKSTLRSLEIPVADDYKVSYGPGYTLVSCLDKGVALRMFKSDMSAEIRPSFGDGDDWPVLKGPYGVERFEIITGSSYFVVILYDAPFKVICCFGRHSDGKWKTPAALYYWEQAAVVRQGRNYILITDSGKTTFLYEWTMAQGLWQRIPVNATGSSRSVAVDDNKFVVYDDNEIVLGYKNGTNAADEDDWQMKSLKYISGHFHRIEMILEKFNLQTDFERAVLAVFRENTIQIKNNLVVLSTLILRNNSQLASVIKTFVIGRDHEIVGESSTIIEQDDLLQLISDVEANENGTKFTLKYIFDEGKFKIRLASLSSSANRTLLAGDDVDRITNEMNSPAKRFLLDLRNYHVSLHGQTVICRNVRYYFGGVEWHRFEEAEGTTNLEQSMSVPLGDRFVVNKTSADDTLKLYDARNNRMLSDLGVQHWNELQIHYPIYLAAQKPGDVLTVIEFMDGEELTFRKATFPKSTELSPFGNGISMVTHDVIDNDLRRNASRIVRIWPMYGVRRYMPDFVVHTVKIILPGGNPSGGSKQRSIGYLYEQLSAELIGDRVQYQEVYILPGKSIRSFGYIVIWNQLTEYFDGEKVWVKTVYWTKGHKAKCSERENHRNHFKDTIFYDRHHRFRIANFFPFHVGSNMSDFIGFEDYENLASEWIFERNDILRGGFSLTGRNYLQLKDKASIKRIYRPHWQDGKFVASSWVRLPIPRIPETGDIVTYLRASVFTDNGYGILNVLGDVKYKLGDWFYMEVVIDLGFTHSALQEANQTQSNNLQVEICVSPLSATPLSVDHVRFSSLHNLFEVNVYDNDLGAVAATIKANGAITRRFYDKYRKQIAEVNESNQIKEFRTYSKDSNPAAAAAACDVRIIPEKGFHDDFSPYQLRKQWKLTNIDSWKLLPETLFHRTTRPSFLTLQTEDIDPDSYGIRFLYCLRPDSMLAIPNVITIHSESDSRRQKFPIEGEILLLKEANRVIGWIDGKLSIDFQSFHFNLTQLIVQGDVKIEQMMVFSRPRVQVIYKNALNEKIQEIDLSSAETVLVRNFLYDELGRQRITTLPVELTCEPEQSLLAYVTDLVSNDDPKMADSVWKTGHLKGSVSEIIGHEFGFSEIVYANNPLNVQVRAGMPGQQFTVHGRFAFRFGSTTSNSFVLKYYPRANGYSYQVQLMPNGREIISVFNENNLKVASYVHVKEAKDRLSTFEYNAKGLMTRSLPPLYYDKVGIFNETTLNLIEIPRPNVRSEHQQLGIQIGYDKNDNPSHLITPDKGPLQNVYDDENKLRFCIQYSTMEPVSIVSIVYFKYDTFGKLISTGSLKNPSESFPLLELKITEKNAREFQHFYHNYFEDDAMFRGKILRTVTNGGWQVVHEEIILDADNNVISKRYIEPNGSNKPTILSINKWYEGGSLKEILYPVTAFGQPFRVAYEYNKLGQMISVGIAGQPDRFLTITYNSKATIASETFTPLLGSNYTRQFKYNDPGFLTEIHDPFMSQFISYTEKAYSVKGYGDGTIARVKFDAKWHQFADSNGIGLQPDSFRNDVISLDDSQRCFDELKREGYLDENNQQTRIFYPDLDVRLSDACNRGTMERTVKEVLGEYGFPKMHGFRFDYGHFMELRKAKYFVGSIEREATAFHRDTFAIDIPGIAANDSKQIWSILLSEGYIEKDYMGYGTSGNSFLRRGLVKNLNSIDPDLTKLAPLLRKLMVEVYATSSWNVSSGQLDTIFRNWFPNETIRTDAIHEMLLRKNYLEKPLTYNFTRALSRFSQHLPEIVGVMRKYLSVGRAEFDMESIEIDANGNHLELNNGFENYQLVYEPNSNRIAKVKYRNGSDETEFEMSHNLHGSVNKASHKGILFAEYHPVSSVLQKIVMINGDVLRFCYDNKGERFMKQVTNATGQKISETQYLRDEKGRTLVEQTKTYVEPYQPPDVLLTAYIYGPKSLIGFVRRDQFYSVITDHQGSTRLVIRDGEVVAAYDYTPYGGLMRIYGSNPDAHISYRYCGQEWDPEIALYNYRSRFYDPSIGRFYQIDPLMQFFNPYKYADNSPVSDVDYSGKASIREVAFGMAVVVFSLIGSYLAGAAANDSFNPFRWDWSSGTTKLAIVYGGITGALIPIGYFTSMKALGGRSPKTAAEVTSVGYALAHMNTAASNNGELNPARWDYTSPKTWWAGFEGFSMGVGIVGGLHDARANFIALNRHQKYMFGGAAMAYGTFSFTMGGTKTKWDASNVEFWLATVTSIISAPELPAFARNGMQFLKKHGTKFHQSLHDVAFQLTKSSRRLRQSNTIRMNDIIEMYHSNSGLMADLGWSGAKLVLGSVGFTAFLSTVAILMNGDFQHWDFTELSTYHNLLAAIHLTTTFFVATEATVIAVRPQQTMFSGRLAEVVAQSSRKYATVVAKICRQDWRFIRLNPHTMQHIAGERHVFQNALYSDAASLVYVASFATFTLVYTRNHFHNILVIDKDDTEPANSKQTYPQLAQIFPSALESLEKKIEMEFLENLCDELNSTVFFESQDQDAIHNCQPNLRDFFQNNKITRDFLSSKLTNLTLGDGGGKQHFPLDTKLIVKEKELISINIELRKESADYEKRRELRSKKIFLQNTIEFMKNQRTEANEQNRKMIIDFVWNQFKEYLDKLLTWQFSSYAEPPAQLTRFIGKSATAAATAAKHIPNPNPYDSGQKWNYLSSYDSEDVPELQSFRQCYNCISARTNVRTVVRDIAWLAILNADFQKDDKESQKRRQQRSMPSEVPRKVPRPKNNRNWFCNKLDQLVSVTFGQSTANTSWNLLEFGDKMFSGIASNENLLLAEVVLAKCCRRKIHGLPGNGDRVNLIRKQEFACDIADLYDRSFQLAAGAVSGFPLNQASNGFMLYEEIMRDGNANGSDQILTLMVDFARKCLEFKGSLDDERRQQFLNSFYNFDLITQIEERLIELNRWM